MTVERGRPGRTVKGAREGRRLYAIIPPMFPPPLAIAPQLAGISQAALNFLIAHGGLLICGLFLLVGLATAGDYGRGPDEANQRQTAVGNLDYILGRADSIQSHFYHDRVYGVAFELPLLLAERALGLTDNYHIHRLRLTLTHLFFIVSAYCCYRLACHLFGNRLIAVLALLFFLLHPRLYAHSFFNSKDLPFVSMFVIALYLLERAFRRDTPGSFILLGLAVGVLTNLRIMGIMLLPAVLAMRGLDLFYAGKGPGRKQILLTGGLFALTAVLTVYALSPYAWTNPGDYLATSLDLTINHPTVARQLFQGEWILSQQLPPHYNAVWFGITTPPPILLLGGLGIVVVLARGLARPGAVCRSGRRRFAGLLLAAFLLPPLAVALLGSNQYDDWKHLYFLYVPFGLLAAVGVHWLTAALARRRRWQGGVYGLAGLGVGLILLQMAQLHPLQSLYFNFLVDRTTPEQLRTRYYMESVNIGYAAGLGWLLKRHPGETLYVRVAQGWELDALAPAARQRLLAPAGGRKADYELFFELDSSRPDLAFNSAYPRRLYNNTRIILRPLDSARMTPTAIAAYREIYQQAIADEPIIRADYDVYFQNHRLTFVKENCPPGEPDVQFGAKVFPPPANRERARPTDFSNNRVRLGDICLAVIQLPDYIQGELVLSQGNLGWEELYSLDPPGFREYIAEWRRQQPPPSYPDAFYVFLDQDAAGRYRLLYAKADCSRAEYGTRVFLHILPENLADLPFYLWESGVDNRELSLPRNGARPGGECLAVYPLPAYPIAAILTGQAGVWERNIYPPADPEPLRAAYAALSAIPPEARSDFALYIQDNRLTYLRESCAAADTAAQFFLHIIPRDTADLPAERQAEGYANQDFVFARWGGHFDGKCLATVPLPDYPIAAIRTGQAGLWEVNFYPPVDPDTLRSAYAALADIPPNLRAVFDLYRQDNQLTYLRETCNAGDTVAGFFLHIIPADVGDLPQERQEAGFANQDFAFDRWGGSFDGKCLATVPLPDYPIASIRTGQHIPGQGEVWAVELMVDP